MLYYRYAYVKFNTSVSQSRIRRYSAYMSQQTICSNISKFIQLQ